MVSTHLKSICQLGSSPQLGVKIKNIWNHHLVIYIYTVCTNWLIPMSCMSLIILYSPISWELCNLPSPCEIINVEAPSVWNRKLTCWVGPSTFSMSGTLPSSLQHKPFSGLSGLRSPTCGTEFSASLLFEAITSPWNLPRGFVRQCFMAFFQAGTKLNYPSDIVAVVVCVGQNWPEKVQKHFCLLLLPWKELSLRSCTIKLVMHFKVVFLLGGSPILLQSFMLSPETCLTFC